MLNMLISFYLVRNTFICHCSAFLERVKSDMQMQFKPLECALDLVTCFYETEYGEGAGVSFLRLGYKKTVASFVALSCPLCGLPCPTGST